MKDRATYLHDNLLMANHNSEMSQEERVVTLTVMITTVSGSLQREVIVEQLLINLVINVQKHTEDHSFHLQRSTP